MLDRRTFLKAMAATSVAAKPAIVLGAGETPAPVRELEPGVRQLFLDDIDIERMEGVKRVVNPPERYPGNPIIRPDKPWEKVCQVYGTALYDPTDELFKIWYLTIPRDRGLNPVIAGGIERPPHTTLASYAESHDGIHWTKPDLGQFPYDGDKNNNLLLLGKYNCEGVSVIHDPTDPDRKKRWKALFWDHGSGGWKLVNGKPRTIDGPKDGAWVAFSPDGINWTHYEGNPVIPKYSDTNQVLIYDPKIERYVAFGRFGFGRKTARSESTDLLHWSKPELVLECDEADGPGTQIYGVGVDLYEGVYLAMVWIYREGGDGKIDTQLATSRDGIHWTRVGDRQTWLELGDDDSWEGGMVRSVERIITRGNELYIYYCGVHGPHTGPSFKKVERKHDVAIGLLTQRRDGFVSLDSGGGEGNVLTTQFRLPDRNLYVNADARDGSITVQLLGSSGEVILMSQMITGDQLKKAIPMNSVPVSPGTPVQLRFLIDNAKLYSYWFE